MYTCPRCKNSFLISFWTKLFAPHMGKFRALKCPNCHKRSWIKKEKV